jgi:hypothetical protein
MASPHKEQAAHRTTSAKSAAAAAIDEAVATAPLGGCIDWVHTPGIAFIFSCYSRSCTFSPSVLLQRGDFNFFFFFGGDFYLGGVLVGIDVVRDWIENH